MTELVHINAVGDLRTPLGFKLRNNRKQPIDLASLTVEVFGQTDAGAEWIAIDSGRVTKHPTRTFTADVNGWLYDNDNLAETGDQIVVATAGTLPSGLVAATRYFVRDWEPNRFKASLSPGGPPVAIADAGTGAHTYYIVGSGQVQFVSGDVDTAGTYWLWINTENGSGSPETWPTVRHPKNRALRVEIVESQ